MSARPQKSPRNALPPAAAAPTEAPAAGGPLNLEERLHRIETMGKRIAGYIQFICEIARQNGTSAEVKERAVLSFYKQMILVENQLGRIQDELRLE